MSLALKPKVPAQNTGRRKQAVLYNIKPVVNFYHKARLTSQVAAFLPFKLAL